MPCSLIPHQVLNTEKYVTDRTPEGRPVAHPSGEGKPITLPDSSLKSKKKKIPFTAADRREDILNDQVMSMYAPHLGSLHYRLSF